MILHRIGFDHALSFGINIVATLALGLALCFNIQLDSIILVSIDVSIATTLGIGLAL